MIEILHRYTPERKMSGESGTWSILLPILLGLQGGCFWVTSDEVNCWEEGKAHPCYSWDTDWWDTGFTDEESEDGSGGSGSGSGGSGSGSGGSGSGSGGSGSGSGDSGSGSGDSGSGSAGSGSGGSGSDPSTTWTFSNFRQVQQNDVTRFYADWVLNEDTSGGGTYTNVHYGVEKYGTMVEASQITVGVGETEAGARGTVAYEPCEYCGDERLICIKFQAEDSNYEDWYFVPHKNCWP